MRTLSRTLGLVCAAALVARAQPASAQDSFADAFWQYKVSTGADYSAGHYGAAKSTDVFFSYVNLRAEKGPWSVKLVLPWIAVSGPAVLLDGRGSGSVGITADRTVSGLGDINLSATYAIERFYDQALFIDLTLRIKMPTASFSKGLGTGEADAAFQVDVAKAWGKFMPFVTFGYRATGRPSGYPLRDIMFGTIGLQYTVSESVAVGGLLDYRQAALRTAADPRESTFYVNWKISPTWTLNTYGVVGYSRNSPDAGGGTTLTYRW